MKPEEKIVANIIKDFCGRQGFRQLWGTIDDDVRQEIKSEWEGMVRQEIDGREKEIERPMKTYILEIRIPEGNDEFWEDVQKGAARKKVKEAIKQTLDDSGWVDAKVKIIDVVG